MAVPRTLAASARMAWAATRIASASPASPRRTNTWASPRPSSSARSSSRCAAASTASRGTVMAGCAVRTPSSARAHRARTSSASSRRPRTRPSAARCVPAVPITGGSRRRTATGFAASRSASTSWPVARMESVAQRALRLAGEFVAREQRHHVGDQRGVELPAQDGADALGVAGAQRLRRGQHLVARGHARDGRRRRARGGAPSAARAVLLDPAQQRLAVEVHPALDEREPRRHVQPGVVLERHRARAQVGGQRGHVPALQAHGDHGGDRARDQRPPPAAGPRSRPPARRGRRRCRRACPRGRARRRGSPSPAACGGRRWG